MISGPIFSTRRNSDQMTTQIIKPAGSRDESLYLIMAVIAVMTVSGIAVHLRTRTDPAQSLAEYQISGYRDLANMEQGTFNDLYAAAMEIDGIHDDGGSENGWPTIKELEAEFIPPFVRDQAWNKRGKVNWTARIDATENTHTAVYMGRPQIRGNSGSFLLVISHKHGPGFSHTEADSVDAHFQIWYHKQPDPKFPDECTVRNLAVKGWKEVIPYMGDAEVKRLKGETI